MEIDLPLPEAIVVAGSIPATPQVLVDESFVTHLLKFQEVVGKLNIQNENHMTSAGSLLNELTKAATKLELARKTVKEPFLEYTRKIDAAAQVVRQKIDTIKISLNDKMVSYQEEVDRLAAEAERMRLVAQRAELKRLEDIRIAEEKKAREEAERIRAAQPKIQQMDFDVPETTSPIEQKIAVVQAAPAIVAPPKPAGARWLVTLKFSVLDVKDLPPEYVTREANVAKIRGLTAGWREGMPMPTLPGVRFYEDRQFQGTGR